MECRGSAEVRGVAHCNKKLCFSATDPKALVAILTELAQRADCFFVKYTKKPRDGMYLGRCFLMDEEAVGTLWAKYKAHPKVLCTVQDDDFTMRFRPLPALIGPATALRGGVLIEVGEPDGTADVERVDALAKSAGLLSEARFWREVSVDAAEELLHALFASDLAHAAPTELSDDEARRAARRFVRWSGPRARFYTIPGLVEAHASGASPASVKWQPIADTKFDAGVVSVSARVALLWFMDD